MKAALVFFCTLTLILSCFQKKEKQSQALELEEIANFALNKKVRFVADSLQLSADELTYVDEPPRIISSIIIYYKNKGTIEFFFPRTSIIYDTLNSKEQYLKKVADRIINQVKWADTDGIVGSIKNATIY